MDTNDILENAHGLRNVLVRRTVDLDRLCLTRFSSTAILPRMAPFGPKTCACLVPAKNFDNPEVDLDPLENYHVWSDIGRGTYAVVKFATARPSGSKVAIKIYEQAKIQDPVRQNSIKTEIKILKLINHPNIAKIIEEINGEKNFYLVLEYVQGFSLQGYVSKRPGKRLDEQEASQIFCQLLEALDYCHDRQISHRDIKLENILMTAAAEVKLIDFGFATVSPSNKKSYIYCGTPNYMAPEIIKKIEYLGSPADMWAAGVVLYVMVAGSFPFASPKEAKLFKKVVSGVVNFPDFVSASCKNLISSMLTQNPQVRITAKMALTHPWVVTKGKNILYNLPHGGDNIEVGMEED